ncbi:hypothetical protein BDN67DRAFT_992696 [Paxillus ammoniavirescens]|nr:hypothetical protein BDN67DRAFT_992696 [Paxillus ammoniavirescens]
MWMGKWWHAIQKHLLNGASVAPVIIATDKTQLMQFSGNKTAYPVYLTLGNLPCAICRKPSQHACILIAYLSVSKMVGKELTKKQKYTHIQQLFHNSMRLVLEPLIEAGSHGVEVTGEDGCVRQVFPILACYVADYPEQCLVMCSKYGMCPKYQGEEWGGRRHTQKRTRNDICSAKEKATSHTNFQDRCREEGVSGGVVHPFWDGFPHCDIHMAITPDILHQLYQGVVKHLTLWCTSLLSEKELDACLCTLPPCFGVWHFKNGQSQGTCFSCQLGGFPIPGWWHWRVRL